MAKTKKTERESFLTRVSSEEQDFEHMRPFLGCGDDCIKWVVGIMKKLRNHATNSETCLGKYLYRNRVIFISQAPFVFGIDGRNKYYFADFYIPATKTVIEIDGHSHENPESIEYDHIRDGLFEGIGVKTIRIKSSLVFNGKFSELIQIPEERFLRKERVRVIPEGQSYAKEKMLRNALHNCGKKK